VPYNVSRHRGWTCWFDYCGGNFAGDASHQLDLARLVLGDPPDPAACYSYGGNFAYGSAMPTPEVQCLTWEYPDFVLTCENTLFSPYMRKSTGAERNGDTFPFWPQNNERIEIYGTKQLMYLGRHGVGWQVFEGDGKLVAQEHGVHPDRFHQPNFIDCIRSRATPNCDLEQAQHSAILIHLGNTAYRVGNQRVTFDAATERFVGNDRANALLKPAYRDPYRVPEQI
jgi:predicted dehydrogenase